MNNLAHSVSTSSPVLLQAHWGDVPTWIGAVGGVIAVSVALWFGIFELRRARRDQHQEQARKVVGWLDIGEFDGTTSVRVLVRNSSTEVATRFAIHVRDLTGSTLDIRPIHINGIPPTEHPVIRRVEVPLPEATEDEVYILESLQFTDAHSVVWVRDVHGLRPLHKDPTYRRSKRSNVS